MTGWSLKRIEYEAHKRKWGGFEDPDTFHPARDLAKQHDWEWAVDHLCRRMEIAPAHRAAAHRFYEAQQTLLGDPPPCRGMSTASDSETAYERARRIHGPALGYVLSHPDLTKARRRTFDNLFHVKQPTLETMRGPKRLNQREEIARIRWVCEVLANHFDGQGYGEGKVNEVHMGVGEGWTRYDYAGQPADAARALEAQGLQTFVAPSGNLYARNPHEASCFQPIDRSPQITASKT